MSGTGSRLHRRLQYDDLESRSLLSALMALPDLIGSATGAVVQPGGISESTVTIQAKNITPHKSSTIFGVFVQPTTSGSGLDPRIVSVLGPNGKPMALQYGRPYVPAEGNTSDNEAVAFVKVSEPGTLTVQVAGDGHSAGSYNLQATLPGDMNGDGQVSLADLPLFADAYESSPGSSNYNPAADFRQNGIVNLYDVKILMHNMPAITNNIPLDAQVNLAPSDQAKYPTSQNSGGETYLRKVTIVGHTTPGSIVITDTNSPTPLLSSGARTTEAYTFGGAAYPTNAKGYFFIPTTNSAGINNNDILILDPFGRQLVRSYPVFWIAYAEPHSSLGNEPGL